MSLKRCNNNKTMDKDIGTTKWKKQRATPTSPHNATDSCIIPTSSSSTPASYSIIHVEWNALPISAVAQTTRTPNQPLCSKNYCWTYGFHLGCLSGTYTKPNYGHIWWEIRKNTSEESKQGIVIYVS